jgi:hypothetical protein
MPKVYTYSEAGGHAHNEDAFETAGRPRAPDCLIVALADGQGGRSGGGRAAVVACRACVEAVSAAPPNGLWRPDVWNGVLRAADAAVADDADAGFTTLVAFGVGNGVVCGASCGDSAALVCCGGCAAVLTARQRKDPPVGSGGALPVYFTARLTPPWAVLALSDGVWKYAGWDAVISLVAQRTGKELIDALRGRAALPNGRLQDDFTAVAVWDGGE